MNENLYIQLRQIAFALIDIDISTGKEFAIADIDNVIARAVSIIGIECDDEAKTRLHTDIEYKYKITHENGHVIFDDYDNRQNWYSNEQINDPYYWYRYKAYLINNTSISPRSITLMEEETLPNIMNCLGNPNDIFEGTRFRRGLIIGDVQSGKTATYSGLICKAADAGYKVVILLAGITESLRQQTQERIDEGIIGQTHKKQGKQTICSRVGVGLDNKELRATSFTSAVNDFVGDHDKIAMSLTSHNSLVVFVVKKNVSVLEKLYKWLRDQNVDAVKQYIDIPMLLIDDEADNASVNTKRDETDPTRTNSLIRQICCLFKNTTYVGFTATPFANVFIDPDSVDRMQNADLFPEHFIYALESPSNYVGADKIFYPEGPYYDNLRYITDIEEYDPEEYQDLRLNNPEALDSGPFYYRHSKEWRGELPNSLEESVLCFFLANAVRDLRGQNATPRSMLVNMSRFVNVQRYIRCHIEDFYNETFNTIRFNFSDNTSQNKRLPLYQRFKTLWDNHFRNIQDISFERVINRDTLINAIQPIKIELINGSKQSGKLDYKTNKSLRVIAVGGLALSRGLTLEGLMVSYFYRNTSTFDVLMQMGRWFGYRSGYEDLFRIWTSRISAEWYAEVALASRELKDDIKNMYEQRLTPKDFGIKVRDNNVALQITAANKMRTAVGQNIRYSYYGNIYDAPYVSFNVEHNRENILCVKELTKLLFDNHYPFRYTDIIHKSDKDVSDDNDGSSRYFADVPKSIVISFLEKIKCSMANSNFHVPSILESIGVYGCPEIDMWDIAIEGGESDKRVQIEGLESIRCLKRSIYCGSRNVVQISSRRRALSGSSEGRFALSQEQISAAEEGWRNDKEERGEPCEGKEVPQSAYFEFLKNRKPILIIMPISPSSPAKEEKKINDFIKDLGDDCLLTFAIGLPGVKEAEKAVHYQVNLVFQALNIEQEEIDED